MPPKHSAPLLRPSRFIFAVAMAILAGLVVWVAVRAVGPPPVGVRQPTVVLPSMPQVPVGVVGTPSPSAFTTSLISTKPSSSRTSRRQRATPSTRVPSKTAKPTTAPPVTLAATVSVGASWDGGYVAGVRVTNTGSEPVSWTVTVTHSGQTGVRLTATWNASGTQRGTSFVFAGAQLAPGATVNFGYQAAEQGQNPARPSGCTVVGGTCAVR